VTPVLRRPSARTRLTARVALNRRSLEAFQLEARRLAASLGLSVTKISVRRAGRTGTSAR
jgi:hypothetical protein